MADIDRFNGKFQARWRDPDGRQRAKLFATKRAAEDHLAEVRLARSSPTVYVPRAAERKVATYAEQWLDGLHDLRPASRRLYRSVITTWIVPLIGSKRMAAVGRPDAERFIAHVAGQRAPASVHTIHAVVTAMFTDAVKRGAVPANPFTGVRLPRKPHRVVEPLTPEVIADIASKITARYEIAVWAGAFTGMRLGEVLGLRVDRIDFLRHRIRVVEQLTTAGEIAGLKSRAVPARVVPADDFLLGKLSAHIAAYPSESGLLITGRTGKPVVRSSFTACWREAAPEGVRYHDLRHFFASSLIAAGLHPKIIQQRLGHANISETMDVYGHLFPEADEAGRGAIDAVFVGSSGQTGRHVHG
jgi:integrase